ncbi:MAG: hypothetical protein QXW80_05875 [Candidatus Micrarchaeia archaeon]
MPKWVSPLFTDMRNALGESVVFSRWKGRQYIRSWVRPANPRTLKQMANRDVLKNLVKRWQAIKSDLDAVAAWNKEALPYLISGYNLFVKYGRLSKIECPATGSVNVAFNITYTLGLPASKARIYRFDGTTFTDITPAGGLSEAPNSTLSHTISSAGTYYFFIANKDVLKAGDTGPQGYQAITKWKPDYTTGMAKEAKIVIS